MSLVVFSHANSFAASTCGVLFRNLRSRGFLVRAVDKFGHALPDNMDALLKKHPLRCPVAFIGALQSEEITQVGMAMTMKITQGRLTMMDGSHLFPMEKPVATAAAIEAALLSL